MPPRSRSRAVAVRTRTVTPKVQIVRVPTAVKRRATQVARRGVTKAAQVARDEKHTLTAVAAAAALGLAKRQGVDLPKVDTLGTSGTYGAVAYVAARMTKSKTLAHVATGLLSVASFQLASGDGLEGDDDDDW